MRRRSTAPTRLGEAAGRRLVLGMPLAWLSLFVLIPFLIVLKISVSTLVEGVPPYAPLLSFEDGPLPQVHLNFENYVFLIDDWIYAEAYLSSVLTAAATTLICLMIGYPMAYGIARARPGVRPLLLMLIILPFWTSMLIRIYAWIGILKDNGLINQALIGLGLIDEPIAMMNTPFAVLVGMTYAYLPFMILPLYATLEKMDHRLLEAAADLGARPWRGFWSVTLPLSLPGIYAGALLVFIPAVGEYVAPTLLGSADTLMISTQIWNEFFSNRDWPVASAVTVVMVLLLVGPLMLLQRLQAEGGGPA